MMGSLKQLAAQQNDALQESVVEMATG